MTVGTGLLEADRLPSYNIDDLLIRGVSFSELVQQRIMTNSFTFNTANRTKLLDLLGYIECRRPDKIQPMTKKKLNLPDSWKVADEKYDESENTEVEIEFKLSDDDKRGVDDLIARMMNDFKSDAKTDPTFTKILKESNWEDFIDNVHQFVEGFDINFTKPVEFSLNHSRRILHHIYNFNEYCICSQVLDEMRINPQTIRAIGNHFKDNRTNIVNALVTYYNDLLHTTSISTPEGVLMNINQDFIDRFDISTRADDNIFD